MSVRPALGRSELLALVLRERRRLLLALAAAVTGPATAMAVPFASKLIIDEVIGRGSSGLLLPVLIGAALAVGLQAASSYTLARTGAAIGQRTVARLRQRLYRHALGLPVGYFDRTPTGALVSRCMNDVDEVRALFGTGPLQILSGTLTAALAFGVLLRLNWLLTLMVTAVLALTAVVLGRGFGRLRPAFHAVGERHAALASRLTEIFGSIRLVKAATAERRETLALARETHCLLRGSLVAYRHVALLMAILAAAGSGLSLGLLIVGSQAVTSGRMTLGDLALFVFLVGVLHTPLTQLVALTGELGRARAALARIREVLSLPTERSADRSQGRICRVQGTVVFDRVSYRYGSGPLVLREVSFDAMAGCTTALVGPNGAGKSTLVGLLLGLDNPSAGRVLIDGQPLPALRVSEYRRQVGAVLQRDQIISGTVAENIRYARPGASTSEFRRAARFAYCDEFVARLPRGYETQVGERGIRLSGGQRQRLAIARAFLADPRILLLDEATNQLDRESEQLIVEALAALSRGRTTFVVAHRLPTIQRADQILVLESGAIAEQGTHEELVGRRGSYWRSCAPDLNGSEVETHAN